LPRRTIARFVAGSKLQFESVEGTDTQNMLEKHGVATADSKLTLHRFATIRPHAGKAR
jgi:predicted DCC family thiol-disulfide oxidoreductase YuxK